ncbi:TPM domain-containing protein [Aurantiacibacter sediminis]|uniref:TPM domain-containing protein n=1 Tax=Aurantiacibacter sediminis TaxID=2793064 RepID=A0ABS0N1H7_9SPHN|nr:TPM domain-containing protein [Aurantiacibacter sediminis]MBH5321812.1 TPM domain-containing protein [Aurantiacibacter sediminis]
MKAPHPAALTAALTIALGLSACGSSEEVDNSGLGEEPVAEADVYDAAVTDSVDTDMPTEGNWLGIERARGEIEEVLASAGDEYAPAFHFVIVESLDLDTASGETPFMAAGLAAADQGGPTIVVSTQDKQVHITGDEGLAYMVEDRNRIEGAMADYFDRGEYVEGIRQGLSMIDEWNTGP